MGKSLFSSDGVFGVGNEFVEEEDKVGGDDLGEKRASLLLESLILESSTILILAFLSPAFFFC